MHTPHISLYVTESIRMTGRDELSDVEPPHANRHEHMRGATWALGWRAVAWWLA